jgi:DNA repair exonuclease SbcCD ATPase subunit
MTEVIYLVAGMALAAAAGFFLAWRSSGRRVGALTEQCEHLEASLAAVKRSLVALSVQGRAKEQEAKRLSDQLNASSTQLEQLRDLVKMHVARRREFEEWANPIRTSLGEGIGKVMRALKDQLARQEFALRRQAHVAAEAQDQYRGEHDELERLRRELTLKNYHIAALNERFIRIEERMQELNSGEVTGYGDASSSAPPTLNHGEAWPQSGSVRSAPSPDTERFSLPGDPSKDWMGVLDDWHRQLQERFDRLDQLQARVRGTPSTGAAEPDPQSGNAGRRRSDSDAA